MHMRMVIHFRQVNMMTGQAEVGKSRQLYIRSYPTGQSTGADDRMRAQYEGGRSVHFIVRDVPGTNKWFRPGGMYEKGASVEAAHCTAQQRHDLTENNNRKELSAGIGRAMESPGGRQTWSSQF